MTDHFSGRHPSNNQPLNGPDAEGEEKIRQLLGEENDGDAVIDASNVDGLGSLTSMDKYQGDLETGSNEDRPEDPESLDLLTQLELRDGETDDVMEAIEEGFTYIPPSDPPVVPSSDLQNADIATGFGETALEAPYDEDNHSSFLPADDEVSARVREALYADSMTTEYARRIHVETRGGVVYLSGVVRDLVDSDSLIEVASRVEGVTEVIDRTKVAGLE